MAILEFMKTHPHINHQFQEKAKKRKSKAIALVFAKEE